MTIPLAVLSSASIRLTTARECGRTFIGVSLSSDKSFGCPVRSPARASGYSTLSYNRRIPSNSSHRLSVELPEEVHVVVPRLRSGWCPRRGQIVLPVGCRILRLPTRNTPPHSQSWVVPPRLVLWSKSAKQWTPTDAWAAGVPGRKAEKWPGLPAQRLKIRADTEGESV